MSTNDDTQRKKRKWDVPAEPSSGTYSNNSSYPHPPSNNEPIESAVQAAAKKLNVLLGGLNASKFEKEIEINEYRPESRYLLCKGSTHDEIMAETKAVVKVRGKYKAPTDTSSERALHLYITADTQESLDAAVRRFQDIIDREKDRPAPGGGGYRQQNPSTPQFVEKVYVGLDKIEPSFSVIGKILGPRGSFVKHISNSTRSKVQLRGRGTGYLEGPDQREADEPMQLCVTASSKQDADSARALCENLLETVRKDYEAFKAKKHQPHNYNSQAPTGTNAVYGQAYGATPYGQAGYGTGAPATAAYGYGAYPGAQAAYGYNQYYPGYDQYYAAYGYGAYPGYGYPADPNAAVAPVPPTAAPTGQTEADTAPAPPHDPTSANPPPPPTTAPPTANDDKVGPKPPSNDDYAAFYAEIGQGEQQSQKQQDGLG